MIIDTALLNLTLKSLCSSLISSSEAMEGVAEW